MKKTIVCILTACMILSPWAAFAQAADQAEVSKAESLTAEEQVEAAQEAFSQGDYEKAMECYQAAADAGSVDALVGIGDLYYYGAGVELSFEKANEYYQLLTLAK